jgi:predicted MFS family arabinose efflux permease
MAGLRLVFGDPRLRLRLLLGWLAASYNVSDGVAAPLGHHSAAVTHWMSPLAVASCGFPMLFVFRPALPASLVILTVGGLFTCYQLAASSAFVRSTPASQRGRAFGIAQGGLSLGQGAAMIAAGAAAQHYSPAGVIAVCGVLGVLAAILITVTSPADRTLATRPVGSTGRWAARSGGTDHRSS